MNLRKPSLSSSGKRAGFTLVEVLAAAAIMLIVVSAVLGLTANVLDTWNNANSQLSGNAEARQAFDLMVTDIESAIVRQNGGEWIAITEDPSVGTLTNTHSIFFYAPVLARARMVGGVDGTTEIPGDICAVKYGLVYHNPFTGTATPATSQRYCLNRVVVDPVVTFNDFIGEPIATAWGSGSYSENLLDDELQRTYSSSAIDYFEENYNLAALNIIGLEITPLKPDASNPGELVPITAAGSFPIILPGDLNSGEELVAIRITLRVLDSEGDELLRYGGLSPTPDLNDPTDDFVLEHTDIYTRTIPVRPSPF